MAWTSPRTWTDGELVTAAIMNPHVRDNFNALGPRHTIAKSADQSVTSSIVLVDDTHLQFAIAASEAWVFRFVMITTGPGLLRVALNAPAGATGWWAFHPYDGASSASIQASATFVDAEVFGTTGNPNQYFLDGYCLNAGTGGTFKLRWAQSSSNGTSTILKKGSWLDARKV